MNVTEFENQVCNWVIWGPKHQHDGGLPLNEKQSETPHSAYRTFNYRWVILLLYCLCCFCSALQWPIYPIIGNILVEYYRVSFDRVAWTGMVFPLWYIICVYPGTYLIEKWGLRKGVLIGSFGGCVGAWIKMASLGTDRFWVLILGQSIVALTQTLLTSTPALLASIWFGPEQVSTACSIGTFGYLFGIAFGCLISPIVVGASKDVETVEFGLRNLALGVASVCTVIFVLAIIGFRESPPTPPSRAQMSLKRESVAVSKAALALIKNWNFVSFLLAYSVNFGIFMGMCVMLNPILTGIYQGAAMDVGRIGMMFVLAGIAGCLVVGTILDKYKKFKETSIFVFTASVATLVIFAVCLRYGITIQYITVTILGFFNNSVFPLGLEVAAEITYPQPVVVSSGMMLISAKVFGILMVHLYMFLIRNCTGAVPHLIMAGLAFVSGVVVVFTRFELKRQQADQIKLSDI